MTGNVQHARVHRRSGAGRPAPVRIEPTASQQSLLTRSGWDSTLSCLLSLVVHLVVLLAAAIIFLPPPAVRDVIVQVWAEGPDPLGEELTELAPTLLDAVPPAASPPATLINQLSHTEAPPLEIDAPSDVAGFAGAPGRGIASDDGDSAGAPSSLNGTTATFFGTVAQGRRFVYILDVSPSMNARQGARLERAVLELLRSIDGLSDRQEFFVIVFGWQTRYMLDTMRPPVARPVPATADNKRRLQRWLGELKTIHGTDPREALLTSRGQAPDAVFLLSDGEFNQPNRLVAEGPAGGRSVEQIVAEFSGLPVQTVAFEDEASAPRMSQVAAVTGGQHRFVPPPPFAADPRGRPRPKEKLNFSVSTNYRRVVRAFRFHDVATVDEEVTKLDRRDAATP